MALSLHPLRLDSACVDAVLRLQEKQIISRLGITAVVTPHHQSTARLLCALSDCRMSHVLPH
jgi:hypothetical protein